MGELVRRAAGCGADEETWPNDVKGFAEAFVRPGTHHAIQEGKVGAGQDLTDAGLAWNPPEPCASCHLDRKMEGADACTSRILSEPPPPARRNTASSAPSFTACRPSTKVGWMACDRLLGRCRATHDEDRCHGEKDELLHDEYF